MMTNGFYHYCSVEEPFKSERFAVTLKPDAKKLEPPGVTCHLLRHSHATMLDVVGAPLGTMQSLLRHSTPETTPEIYLPAIPEVQRRTVGSVERLAFGRK